MEQDRKLVAGWSRIKNRWWGGARSKTGGRVEQDRKQVVGWSRIENRWWGGAGYLGLVVIDISSRRHLKEANTQSEQV